MIKGSSCHFEMFKITFIIVRYNFVLKLQFILLEHYIFLFEFRESKVYSRP